MIGVPAEGVRRRSCIGRVKVQFAFGVRNEYIIIHNRVIHKSREISQGYRITNISIPADEKS